MVSAWVHCLNDVCQLAGKLVKDSLILKLVLNKKSI